MRCVRHILLGVVLELGYLAVWVGTICRQIVVS